MPFDPEDSIFLLPGPVKMHPRVLRAMSRPSIAHRSPEFSAVNEQLFNQLRKLLDTKHVAVMTGSGTLGMEAAVSNLVKWGDKVVGLSTGKFGSRMASLGERYAGAGASTITCPWGETFDFDAVEKQLEEGAKALLFTLNETSTGAAHDGRKLAKLAKKHGALSIADTITATGSVPTPMNAWGLDVAIMGSQKCIGGPAGLAFVGISENARKELESPTLYMDLEKHLVKAEKDNQTPFTPAVPLHYACVEALDIVFTEGLEARFKRTKMLADGCRAAADAAGLDFAAAKNCRSDTVTAIKFPKAGMDNAIRGGLKNNHNVVIAGAQDSWKGNVFRIGHMAQTSWAEMAATWAALEVEFRRAGSPLNSGAQAALLDFAP